MSIDFDSAALQTQHEEEEYDQEDYAREQELHKLLTDLPDDMLEDSRDDSSQELNYSACSNKVTDNSSAPHAQEYQYSNGGYLYTSTGTAPTVDSNDFSTEGYEPEPYPHGADQPALEYPREGPRSDEKNHGAQINPQQHHQKFDRGGSGDRRGDSYKASSNPQQLSNQPKMFNPTPSHQDGHFDRLQREFLDTAQNTTDSQQFAQLQILNKAQQRQIEDLEQKLEDSRRNMRYLEHQFAIVKDEKDGHFVSLKESSRLLEEAKEREAQMQAQIQSLQLQVQTLTEQDHENIKKQSVAEAAVDSMQQQMLELCRSDTLSRTREQHDRDLAAMREQHEAKVLGLQQKLDSSSQALDEQMELGRRLREQVKQLERQREEEQVERAGVVNQLTQRLEESQQQCAKLLQTGSVQEMSQVQIKLQQALSAKSLSENMNKVLQEDLADLNEQITLYESAVKHGVIVLDLNSDWENQLSDSCVDLGIKKANWKNNKLHRGVLAGLAEPKLPKEEAERELKTELQRCLASLKGKRRQIDQIREDLRLSQGRGDELQAQLERAQLTATVKGAIQEKPLDRAAPSQAELQRLEEDRQRLQGQVEALEKKNKELKLSEEKVRSANTELCTKMREMIQELDQEKQEAAERYERTQQQYRDDVVNRVREELALEYTTQAEQLTAQYQPQITQLQSKLSEVHEEMLAVQECYISVCKEKDRLEESLQSRVQAEAELRANEQKRREESSEALEKLRAELEAQHQASVEQLQALWAEEREHEVQQQVHSMVAASKAGWEKEQEKLEKDWTQRLEEARRHVPSERMDSASQTDQPQTDSETFTREELDSRLRTQGLILQRQAEQAGDRAVEEARKRAQRELLERHLEDMAKQVEGAVTRAYHRWLEDLTSLPEYKSNLQREREQWEELQAHYVQEQISKAVRQAELQWQQKHRDQFEEQGAGAQKLQELHLELASLQEQLELARGQQAALLRAELAGARAAWNRDKQQEISSIRARGEQQHGATLEQALRRAREEWELQNKELLLGKEAELQQALRAKQEEWRGQQEARESAHRQQAREEVLEELRAALAEVQTVLLKDLPKEQQNDGQGRGPSDPAKEGIIRNILHSACKDFLAKSVGRAKKEWKKISEERLGQVLEETQKRHEREISQLHNSGGQGRGEARCGKHCADTVGKLQKKNQDLQRHLEKACRQLQHTVRDHKGSVQRLKEEHEASLQKAQEDGVLKLEEVKRSTESSRHHQQNLNAGLEEMKLQYMRAVEKIRGDMLRYLQESKERAAEMIRVEVLRERQDTARKMRHYYLTCLQELLEDGGQSAGAEKKILNAASKLVAMAKVLETPMKSKSLKIHSLKSSVSKTEGPADNTPGRKRSSQNPPPLTQVPETQSEKGTRMKTVSKPTQQCVPVSGKERGSKGAVPKPLSATSLHQFSPKPSHQAHQPPPVDRSHERASPAGVTPRTQSREVYMQGLSSGEAADHLNSESQRRPFLIQEPPVRDEGQSDWSSVSSESHADGPAVSFSYLGRKVEPVKPFSLCAQFSNGDSSDMTVYKDIAHRPSQANTIAFPGTTISSQEEPIPGSEGEKQYRVCSKTMFTELKLCHQDSGFDSPFYIRK
ncbi:centrosomal protein of 152 kDa [Aplochiton taeniatus]